MSYDPASHKPFRVRIRVYNNRLIKARERLGYMSAKAAADAFGFRYDTLRKLEKFEQKPVGAQTSVFINQWTKTALDIASAYMCDPEDLWPKEALLLERARGEFEASGAEMLQLCGENAEQHLLRECTRQEVQAALSCLSKREVNLLMAKYDDETTLKDIGAHMPGTHGGKSRERIRQEILHAERKVKMSIQSTRIREK